LVVAVDDMDQSLAIVDLAREHFPHLEIVARARDVRHWRQLMERNVTRADRELFESSLMSSRHVLEVLGYPAHEARQAAMTFRRHNLALIERLRPLSSTTDRDKLIATIKASRAELEQQMAAERADREARRQLGKRPFDEILADLGVQPHLPKADP